MLLFPEFPASLIVVLLLLAAFVWGMGTMLVGWRQVRGGVPCLLVVAAVLLQLSFEGALEMNPYPVLEDDVVGEWSASGKTLNLTADHRYVYRAEPNDWAGEWKLNDFNLVLVGYGKMRVIRFRGRLRVLTKYTGPDTWDGNLGLKKQ